MRDRSRRPSLGPTGCAVSAGGYALEAKYCSRSTTLGRRLVRTDRGCSLPRAVRGSAEPLFPRLRSERERTRGVLGTAVCHVPGPGGPRDGQRPFGHAEPRPACRASPSRPLRSGTAPSITSGERSRRPAWRLVRTRCTAGPLSSSDRRRPPFPSPTGCDGRTGAPVRRRGRHVVPVLLPSNVAGCRHHRTLAAAFPAQISSLSRPTLAAAAAR